MKAMHFGAGNIGKGFIGLMLSNAGYEVTFVTRNPKKRVLLQQKKQYVVTYANKEREAVTVKNVTAIDGKDAAKVAETFAQTDLVTTAVGVSALKYIAPSIATGIQLRLLTNRRPLHIIACENALAGSTKLKKEVYTHLPEELHAEADRYIAFPNTAVDRIVPIQLHDDPLKITVEPFYEWVIDRSNMFEGFHEIEGVHYVDSLQPYIERKLFTVNTGHCSAAYLGYLHGYETIQEAMSDPQVNEKVKGILTETGNILTKKYKWTKIEHQQYIQKIVNRFTNPHLKDKVVRVGRSPIRKLSANDRLIRPLLESYKLGIEAPHLTSVVAAALLFDYEKDPEAVRLQEAIEQNGIQQAINTYTGIYTKHPYHQKVVKRYKELKQKHIETQVV